MSHDFADDAAVVRAGDGGDPLVLTADVITPLVDDPRIFGQIAAANALSDVYAMGGRPLFALNLIFFPSDKLPGSVLREILLGANDTCAAAGVAVVGGHSVKDDNVKFGLSVTGVVPRDRILSNRGGQSGQRLVLSKALGTGAISTAIREGLASAEELESAVASMTTLNRDALALGLAYRVSACTDVTGFGLLGHLRTLARGSGLSASVHLGSLPLLLGALEHTRSGRSPGGSRANLEFLRPWIDVDAAADPARLLLAADAQTSGGLLLAVDSADAAALVQDLRGRGLPAADIGELRESSNSRPPGHVTLVA